MSEALDQEILTLESLLWSERDPDGLAFAPLADARLRNGQVKEALDLLAEGMARQPEYATGHVVAMRLYYEQGMHSEAEFAARRVLELDAENIAALSSLASIVQDRGDFDEVAGLLATLTAVDPDADEARPFAVDDDAGADAGTDELPPVPGLGDDVDGDTSDPWAEQASERDVANEAEVMDLGALAPDAESDVLDLGALAPDDDPEPAIMDLGALAPDVAVAVAVDVDGDADAEDEVVDLGGLAPDPEPDAEVEVMDLGALAPDADVEPEVLDLGALAPDDVAEVEVADLAVLAPDAEPEADVEIETMDLGALAPDAEPDVMDLGALAPDDDPEPAIMDLGALAPDDDPEPAIMDLGALVPDADVEPEVMELGALAPDDVAEVEVADLAALAPDAEPEAEVEVMDLGALAPDDDPEPAVMDLGSLAPDADADPEPEVMDLGAPAPDGDVAAEPEVADLGALAPDAVFDLSDLSPDVGGSDDGPEEHDAPVYTRTLAELYIKQGLVDQALNVYRQLLSTELDVTGIEERIAELEQGGGGAVDEPEVSLSTDGEAGSDAAAGEEDVETLARDLAESGNGGHEVDTPFAWPPDADDGSAKGDDGGPEIGDYFDNLLGWEPPSSS